MTGKIVAMLSRRDRLVVASAVTGLILAGCSGKSSSKSSGGLTVVSVTVPRETRTYAVPSSSMEPTLHCGRPAPGCEADVPDRVEVATPSGGSRVWGPVRRENIIGQVTKVLRPR